MRLVLLLLSLTIGTLSTGQMMLPAAEWCAAGKKFGPPAAGPGPDMRSDSIDILHTAIRLEMLFTGQQIAGSATLDVQARVNGVSEIRLDLLGLAIDSITGLSVINWSYNGQEIRIKLMPMPSGDLTQINVYYHGQPVQDASTWGGFYWQGSYAYNLGVGFAADPHSFGRAWFPCFDNFVERCSFQFDIITPADRPAYCNGALTAEELLSDNRVRRRWTLDRPIPSYLACTASGPYASYRRTLAGEAGPVPVEIAVSAVDSNKLKASFTHLPDALAAFEYWYGPYRWNKIGYSIVPFNSGAMEHATNIAYMRAAVDGTTTSETLFAHELSHHWWGDLATCSTAEDMWLNEGWAVYSEHLFLEKTYGPERFRSTVESNFLNVLEKTHVNEGGYRAVSGLPHDLTYGEHVYNKGAVVAHNLRGYLGDSLFRSGIREALADNQFSDWSSAGFRDKLSAATGEDLHDFFDDWVFAPGFTHFSIDSVRIVYSPIDAPTAVTVFVKQKLRGAPHFYQNVPLEFTFVHSDGQREYRTARVSGESDVIQFSFPAFQLPIRRIWVNTRQHLTTARAEKELVVNAPVNYSFTPARLTLKINSLGSDSVLIRAEHHYVMPDTAGSANPGGYRLTNRYWSIDAFPTAVFDAEGSFFYDGRGKLDQLDTELFAQTSASEDSVILLYRPGPGLPWQPFPEVQKNTLGSPSDRYGLLRASHVKVGEYTIAKGANTVAAREPAPEGIRGVLSPNPARQTVHLQTGEPVEHIAIFGATGELVGDIALEPTRQTDIRTADWPSGTYWLILSGKGKSGVAGPLTVVR